jgi:hypothetical protein
MGILLLLLGVLAAGSGAVKLTARARRHHPAGPLATVEAIVGVALVVASGLGLARIRPVWAAVVVTGLVVIASSATALRRARAARAERTASEGLRLRQYVESRRRPGRR